MQTQTVQTAQRPCVMLVEDDQYIGAALTQLLKDRSYRVDPTQEQVTADLEAPLVAPAEPSPKRASLLVVDDELMMCELLRNMLQDDYDVTTLSSSRAALDRLLQPKMVDVVLCDLMMPELTGMDLHAEILRNKPEQAARFIFMTGGTFTDRASKFLDQIETPPLLKPFRNGQLHSAIAERLSQHEPQADLGHATPDYH